MRMVIISSTKWTSCACDVKLHLMMRYKTFIYSGFLVSHIKLVITCNVMVSGMGLDEELFSLWWVFWVFWGGFCESCLEFTLELKASCIKQLFGFSTLVWQRNLIINIPF